MIRVAIVEDNDTDAAVIQEHFLRYGKENGEIFDIIRFNNPLFFLDPYTADYDLIIMDIQMPYMNGMDAAYRLRELDENVLLFFVTSMTQYAIEGYEVKAANYIVKPVQYADFALKLKKALRAHTDRSDYLLINTEYGKIRIAPSKIRYLESVGHNVLYHTANGDYTQYISLTKASEPLADKGFFRCNSCYVVNLAYVKNIKGFDAILDSETLKISQTRKKAFLEAYKAYYK